MNPLQTQAIAEVKTLSFDFPESHKLAKAEALESARGVTAVSSAFDNALCVDAMSGLKERIVFVESWRKASKRPIIDLGKLIEDVAEKETQAVGDEYRRLERLASGYASEQRRIAQEAERKRQAELDRIERERVDKEREAQRKLEADRKAAEAEAEKKRQAELDEIEAKKRKAVAEELSKHESERNRLLAEIQAKAESERNAAKGSEFEAAITQVADLNQSREIELVCRIFEEKSNATLGAARFDDDRKAAEQRAEVAKNQALRDADAAKLREESRIKLEAEQAQRNVILSAKPVAKTEGQSVRTRWDFEVVDMGILYHAKPELVHMVEKRADILKLLASGVREIAGLRIFEDVKAGVRS